MNFTSNQQYLLDSQNVILESDFENEYLDYVKGENLTNRMPLYIKPKEKISLNDTFWFMRGHYENTYFDMSVDVGAGPFQSIYRVSIVSIYLFSYIHLIISNTNIIYIYIYYHRQDR